jgi:hypothetical protein
MKIFSRIEKYVYNENDQKNVGMFMRMRFPGIVCASIVWMGVAVATPKPVMAAAAEETTPPSESALAEIIVTATRRSERLQDVPMSITALSGVELTRRGANPWSRHRRRSDAGPGHGVIHAR